jgi:hypothetical protein
MIEVQTSKPRWRRLDQVTIFLRRGPPPRFAGAVLDQRLVEPKLARLGGAPGLRSFSPNSVAELRFTLEDELTRRVAWVSTITPGSVEA